MHILLLLLALDLSALKEYGNTNFQVKGYNTWTRNGPFGGFVNSLTYDGSNVYAGLLLNGVYKNVFGAWSNVSPDFRFENVIVVYAKGKDTIFAGVESGGLWETMDGGGSWFKNTDIPDTFTVSAIYAVDDTIIFLGTDKHGIYRSTNGGINWFSASNSQIDTLTVTSFAYDSSTYTIYAGTNGGIFRSSVSPVAWSRINSPNNVNALLFTQNILYAGCDAGLLYMITTPPWQSTNILAPVSGITKVPDIDSIFVSTQTAGVWTGLIGSDSLYKTNNGLVYDFTNSIIAISDTIYVGTCGGVYISTDLGNLWYENNQGLDACIVWDIEINPVNRHSLYAATLGGIFISDDNGLSWSRMGNPPPIPLFLTISTSPADTNIFLAGGYNVLYRTANHGTSWSERLMAFDHFNDVKFNPNNPATAFAVTSSEIYRSTDGGVNWTNVYSGINMTKIAYPVTNPDTIFITTRNGVLRSDDNGGTFNLLNSGLPSENFRAIACDGYFGNLLWSSPDYPALPSIYISNDAGGTWSPSLGINLWIRDLYTITGYPFLVYASDFNNRVFMLSNGGTEWISIPQTETTNINYTTMFNPSTHTLFLGDHSGVLSYTDTLIDTLTASPSFGVFSPDGDRSNDTIAIHLNVFDRQGIYYWKASIVQGSDTIQQDEGFGYPDSIMVWDGFDSSGVLRNNGLYDFRVFIVDGFLNLDSVSRSIQMSKQPMVSGLNTATQIPSGRKVAYDISSGRVHIVYATFPYGEIFYTYTDNGNVFSEPVNLSNSKSNTSGNPLILLTGSDNNIFVIWEEKISGTTRIFARRNAGGVWEPLEQITSLGNTVKPSAVGDDNGDVMLVWEQKASGEIYYSIYDASALSWSSPANLSQSSGNSFDPFVIKYGSDKIVFYCDDTGTPQPAIKMRRYNGTWQAETTITGTGNLSHPFAISDSLGCIHLVWEDTRLGNTDIYYKQYKPGTGWLPDTNLTNTIGISKHPTLSLDSLGNLYLFWQEDEKVYMKIHDHQNGWLETEVISTTGDSAFSPSSSEQPYVVWTEGNSFPYTIRFYIATHTDTTGPSITIEAPETTYLNTELGIRLLTDEPLGSNPVARLIDSFNDSLDFTVTKIDNYTYTGSLLVSGLSTGMGEIRVYVSDVSGNSTLEIKPILIDSLDTIPPVLTITAPDTGFLGDTLHFTIVSSESLASVPTSVLYDVNGDSLVCSVVQTGHLTYGGHVYLNGISLGMAYLVARGSDLRNNTGIDSSQVFITYTDTIPPLIEVTYPDTIYIGDSIFVNISSEEFISQFPVVSLISGDDTLYLDVVPTSMDTEYVASRLVSGMPPGDAQLYITYSDTMGNSGDTLLGVFIGTKGAFFPDDSCFIYPNPVRGDQAHIVFYLNQDARVRVELYNLTGKLVQTLLNEDYPGGILHDIPFSTQNLGTDIYFVRFIATGNNNRRVIIKKLGVVK